MSIQSEIDRIEDARDDAFAAVAAKGVTVPAGATIDDLPALIRAIPAGGSGGGVSMELLWTNPSPTSSFAAQNTSLDLSGYDLFGVILKVQAANQYDAPMAILTVDGVTKALGVAFATSNNNCGRRVTYDTANKRLTWEAGYYNGSTNNNYAIPYKIFGIRL